MKALIIVGIIFGIVMVYLFVLAVCIVSGKASKAEEALHGKEEAEN